MQLDMHVLLLMADDSIRGKPYTLNLYAYIDINLPV